MSDEKELCVVTVRSAWKQGRGPLRFWILSQLGACWVGIVSSAAGMVADARGDQIARYELLGVVCLCFVALHHAKRAIAKNFGITLR